MTTNNLLILLATAATFALMFFIVGFGKGEDSFEFEAITCAKRQHPLYLNRGLYYVVPAETYREMRAVYEQHKAMEAAQL